ncbi:MAG: hypothetical protein HC854_18190 [Flavobacterium sp.]|nr:hypothetical protein [Flavobacterium sp.]
MEIIAKETCDCISKKKEDLNKPLDDKLTAELGVCMLSSYQKNIDMFKEGERLDFSNSAEMRAFGEKIALQMVNICPDVILALGRSKIAKDEKANESNDEESFEEDLVVEGKVKSISTVNYLTLKVTETNGKNHDFIVLTNFDNAYLLTDKVLKPNSEVEVYYYELDIYDIKLNKFISQK